MKQTEPEFISLALDQVRPSARNPRKTFDKAAMDQLAASIAAKGVLEPILVRPRTLWQMCCGFVMRQKAILDADEQGFGLGVGQFEGAGIKFSKSKKKSLFDDVMKQLIKDGRAEATPGLNFSWRPGPKALDPLTFETRDPLDLGIDHYEIICGERRWRAAAIAGLEAIPALVRDLDEHDAAEVRVIENDQREDVPPLEQAEGYKDLIDMGDDVESIAAKIGRPAKYVAGRLALTNLIEPLKEDLRTSKLPFGHAHLLARLPAAEQQAFTDVDNNGGLYDYDDRPIPLEDLRREIRQDFVGLLNEAHWDRDDETLVPAAGSCAKCMKRSGANPTLFDELVADAPLNLGKKLKPKDLKPDHCTDRTCFAAKKTAFIELQLKTASEKAGGVEAVKITDRFYSASRNGEVLGKDRYEVVSAKEAKTDANVKPAVVVEGDAVGKQVFIRTKKASAGRADNSYAKQQKANREKAKAENKARIEALGMVALKAAASKRTLAMMRQLTLAALEVASGEVCRWIATRRELPAPKNSWDWQKPFEDLVDTLDEPGCLGLIAEAIAGKYAQYNWTDPAAKQFWDAFGIDRGKLVKSIEVEDKKDKPTPKAKKRKAGAK